MGKVFQAVGRLFSNAFRFFRNHAFIFGILFGIGFVFAGYEFLHRTSTNVFCGLCHMHPESEYSWKRSTHYKNESGMVVNCVDCHLPPMGVYYLTEKTRLGVRDAWGALTKDAAEIDWEAKSVIEHAVTYTYDSSCIRCHTDLYSLNLSPKGVEAHEYYMENTDKLRCINCHITVGHYQEGEVEEFDIYADQETVEVPMYEGDPDEFVNYTETIPGTDVSFNMIAVPGGEFTMGSPEDESYREDDEGPRVTARVSDFWMGEIEVSWQEYEAFFAETSTGERDTAKDEQLALASAGGYDEAQPDSIDAVTGPTPPYGSPDQGWGRGLRPAITMTHHAAMRYCEWLSEKTGRRYRLPTEAEWEYACRGGTDTPYYFEAEPSQLTERKLLNKILGTKDDLINPYVWYERNSSMKSQPGYTNEPNPFGLYNMLGNVREFCIDWYDPGIYADYAASGGVIADPRGPESGEEHVVRGGSFNSDPVAVRSADRDYTRHDAWLVTDPQQPKSIWWYSDVRNVGFRVIREPGETEMTVSHP